MSTTQTPITKEGLIELGFDQNGFFMAKSSNDVSVVLIMNKSEFLSCYIAQGNYDDPINPKVIRMNNLKSIEQLKTIIEVCL